METFLSKDVVDMGNSLTILQSQVTESFKILLWKNLPNNQVF